MYENVNVCITPKGDKPVLHFSQFDNKNVFTVTVLADDGESAAVLTGLDIEFRLRKTDSHVVTIAPESVADNVITFKTTEQMCACCGQNIATVTLMKDDMVVSTLDILVDIQRDILSGGLTSESDIRNLTTQIEQIVPEVVGDDYYNKQEVDDLLAEHTFDPSNYYNKQEVDEKIAEIPTFDPSNYYDKSDVDDLLEDKADADDVYTKAETDNLLADKADKSAIASLIVQKDVAKAPIASFNTDLAEALTKIIVDINPVQDLHGYSKPWSGGGGKNKLEPCITSGTVNGITYTVNDDGTIRLSNTATSEAIKTGTFDLKAGSYIYTSGVTESFDTYDTYLSISGTTIARGISGYNSFTLAQDSTVMLGVRVRNGITPNITIKPMIRLASVSDATFEPYENICPISGFSALNVTLADGDMQTVDTVTVNFGQTVYGGSLDVTNGKVTIERVAVDLGTLTWTKQTSVGGTKTYFRTASELADCKKNTNVGQLQGLICSNYAEDTWSHTVDTVGYDSTICTGWTNKSYIAINDQSKVSMSADDFKTAMSGVMLVYELATPIEITTTPENLTAIVGQNNVYADANGDTEVRFTETIGNELGV